MISEITSEWSKPLMDSMKGVITPHITSNKIDRYTTEAVTLCRTLARQELGRIPKSVSKQSKTALDLIKKRNYTPL
jgi:hypothetical protein